MRTKSILKRLREFVQACMEEHIPGESGEENISELWKLILAGTLDWGWGNTARKDRRQLIMIATLDVQAHGGDSRGGKASRRCKSAGSFR